MKRKIVVTGFGPFAGHDINASWETVKLIPGLWDHEEFDVIIDEIPVSYEFVKSQVTQKWADHCPVFYVHIGVSHMAKIVTLETLAHNKCYDKPDIYGTCPEGQW